MNEQMLEEAHKMAEMFRPLCNEPVSQYCAKFAGYSLPPYFPLYWPHIYNFPVEENDVWVCTPPKAGTTWTQHLTYLVMTEDFECGSSIDLFERSPFLEFPMHIPFPPETVSFPGELPSPRLMKTHLAPALLPRDIAKAKMIFVYRNAKDAAVSFYHHYLSFKRGPYGGYDGPFEEFVKMYMKSEVLYMPYGKLVADYFKLKESGKIPNMLVLRYEDMKADLRGTIRKVADFLGKKLSDETVEKIYNETTFEGMAKNDAANNSRAEDMGAWSGTKFLRKGKVGDWQNYFKDDKLREEFDQHIKETIPPELYHILE